MSKPIVMTEEDMELLRRKTLRRYYVVFILTGIFYLLLLILSIWGVSHDTTATMLGRVAMPVIIPVFFTIPAAFFFYILVAGRAYERFSNLYKDRYVLSTIRQAGLFADLSYDKNGGFTYEDICAAAVVQSGLKPYYRSEDLVCGCYGAVRFTLCDVTTKRVVRSGKSVRTVTIFNGQVLRFSAFDETKSSFGLVQIFHKGIFSNMRGLAAPYKIKMEDAAFNETFDVYASDEHNAYYILTPQLLGDITRFSELVGVEIAISILGPAIHIAVNRRMSIFDPKVDIPIAEQKKNILADCKLIQTAGDLLLRGV